MRHVVVVVLVWQGTLKGYDQLTNLVLENCHERVFSPSEGVEQIVLGLYIMRGDSMCESDAVHAALSLLGVCWWAWIGGATLDVPVAAPAVALSPARVALLSECRCCGAE